MTSIQSNLKFLTEIALFYPVILQALSDATEKNDSYGLILKWGLVMFCLITSYLFVDYFQNNSAKWARKSISVFIIGGIVSFAVQFYLLGLLFTKGTIPLLPAFVFMLSTTTVIVFPVIILLFTTVYLTINYFLSAFKKFNPL